MLQVRFEVLHGDRILWKDLPGILFHYSHFQQTLAQGAAPAHLSCPSEITQII